MSGDGDTVCFDKQQFFGETFSVDSFVSKHRQNVTLEKLRDDLHLYLKYLQNSMIELINQDYADFVNLSTNMVGLDKYIQNIAHPLEQLKDEVLEVRSTLQETLENAEFCVNSRKQIAEQKMCLEAFLHLQRSVDQISQLMSNLETEWPEIILRLYQTSFISSRCDNVPCSWPWRERLNAMSVQAQAEMDSVFLRAVNHEDVETINSVLRLGIVIDSVDRIEQLFRIEVVRPGLQDIVSEKVLKEVNASGMFNQVLMFISTRCKVLIELTSQSFQKGMNGYDFLSHSIWPELYNLLEARIPSLFSVSSADLFHKRYTSSIVFLDQLSQMDKHLSLKATTEYFSFLAKWNLPVYFQLRYQEIASVVEVCLNEKREASSGGKFRLKQSEVCWSQLQRCWSDDVFLKELVFKFWRFTLQITSRYQKWIIASLGSILQPPVISSDFEAETASSAGKQTTNRTKFVAILELQSDLSVYGDQINPLVAGTVEPVLADKATMAAKIDLLRESCRECLEGVSSTRKVVTDALLSLLTDVCSQPLHQVIDIPRLFRRTNRDVPSVPSTFVDLVTAPLDEVRQVCETTLGISWKFVWTEQVLGRVTQRFLTLTSDLLESVRKMEDSLKRLKKDRAQKPSSGTISDDDKIRLQLVLDVKRYGDNMESLGVSSVNNVTYCELLKLVETAAEHVMIPQPSS